MILDYGEPYTPRMSVLIRDGKEDTEIQRKRPRDVRGRDGRDAATSHGTLEPPEARKGSPPSSLQRECDTADTLILNF